MKGQEKGEKSGALLCFLGAPYAADFTSVWFCEPHSHDHKWCRSCEFLYCQITPIPLGVLHRAIPKVLATFSPAHDAGLLYLFLWLHLH